MNSEIEEKFIQELMGKSRMKMPFTDFEEQLMQKIHKEAITSRSSGKEIKLSWFFFVVGTLFGLMLNFIVMEMNKTILGLPLQRLMLISQALFIIFLVFQFDKLIALKKNAIGHHRDT
jgi:hypothetical protein